MAAEQEKMSTFNVVVRPDLLGKMRTDDNKLIFAVKANIGCGHPASSSTPSLRHFIPKGFSPVVQSLVDCGHQIVAITNMHELAFGITAENPVYGDVDNPRKTGYIAGGSSGGSAAAVAMNAVSFALGTDTGGSMRIPASLCGVVGYRPTIDLYDQLAVCLLSSTTDTIGVFAQQVATVQHVHKTITPSYSPVERSLSDVRIGVPRQYYYEILNDEVSRVTEAALQCLKKAGAEIVEVDFSPGSFNDVMSLIVELVSYEAYRLVPKYLKDQGASVTFDKLCEQIGDQSVKGIFHNAAKVSDESYRQSQQRVEEIRTEFDNYFKQNSLEVFVTPTTILPAIERPSKPIVQVAGQELGTFMAYVHNTTPQALAGVPCISLPSGLSSDGLPVGLEVVAPRGMDNNLLDLAAAIQAVLPPLPQLNFEDFKDKV